MRCCTSATKSGEKTLLLLVTTATALLLPAVWVLAELARGYLLTGFPWLTVGYSQAAESPLAGYAPLLGVYGVSLVVATSAGLLAWGWQGRAQRAGKLAMLSLAVLWLGGAVLRGLDNGITLDK